MGPRAGVSICRHAGSEARRKGVDVVLGPTINLHRSPLGGRHFEAFSEDPLLTAHLADAYVRGLQDHGVGATLKHYVANDFETERFTVNVVVGERALRELYLVPFEQAVVEARAWVVMSAYNSVDGHTMTENSLLETPLCDEWGFDGVVVSDWTAVRSTVPSAGARQDLVMPGPDGPWGDALIAAVLAGRVPEAAIDEKVLRLLRLAGRVGALTGSPQPTRAVPPPARLGLGLAREVCAAGMVLARNTGEFPWPASGPRSIALIGEHAALPRTQGGGSATVLPENVVSPLEGLRAALPTATITWSRGVPVNTRLIPLPASALIEPISGEPGVRARFMDADGNELSSERRLTASLVWLGTAPAGACVLELRTRYHPTQDGPLRLGVACAGRLRLAINHAQALDVELIAAGSDLGAALFEPPTAEVAVNLTAGHEIELAVSYTVPSPLASKGVVAITLGTEPILDSVEDGIAAAVAAAQQAEVAVVVVGTTAEVESESFDRTSLALPGAQDKLVPAVAAANPRTVVVVNAGSPVILPWRDEVAAILLTWFGGQEVGTALAEVLLGQVEPGGRLPVTWPAAEADVPVLSTTPLDGALRYDEGIHIGYRAWLRKGTAPAHSFGYGLGYTTWDLSGLEVTPSAESGVVDVSVVVRNTGARAGKQVVQVYLSRAESAIDRPIRWLAAFATLHAEPGTQQQVHLILRRRAFSHWDNGWRIEPGSFHLHVGTSLAHLPLTTEVTVS